MKTYKIGNRINSFGILLGILLFLLIFCFYFIYDYVMTPAIPWLKGAPLIAIFLFLEVVMIVAVRWGCRKYRSSVTYVVTPQALEIHTGKNKTVLKWKEFEKAFTLKVQLFERSPVTYTVRGKRFSPSQYLDEIWELNRDIVSHIRDHAEIEEGLDQMIEAFT